MTLQAEISFDSGTNWQFFTAFATAGGALPLDKFGQPQTSSSITTAVTTPCQLRGSVTFLQPLTTTITITVT